MKKSNWKLLIYLEKFDYSDDVRIRGQFTNLKGIIFQFSTQVGAGYFFHMPQPS